MVSCFSEVTAHWGAQLAAYCLKINFSSLRTVSQKGSGHSEKNWPGSIARSLPDHCSDRPLPVAFVAVSFTDNVIMVSKASVCSCRMWFVPKNKSARYTIYPATLNWRNIFQRWVTSSTPDTLRVLPTQSPRSLHCVALENVIWWESFAPHSGVSANIDLIYVN